MMMHPTLQGSCGIQVAGLAGLPQDLLARAWAKAAELAQTMAQRQATTRSDQPQPQSQSRSRPLTQLEHDVLTWLVTNSTWIQDQARALYMQQGAAGGGRLGASASHDVMECADQLQQAWAALNDPMDLSA